MSESILTSELLSLSGIQHGFTTRVGGVSEGPYHSLNLSAKTGDDPEHVARNRRSFERLSGVAWDRLVCLEQVHGTEVLLVDRMLPDLPMESERRFDASVTSRPDVYLAVLIADCVPILLASSDPRGVAAVHAGWRGTLNGVVERAVAVMVERLGCRASEIVAAIGPCIRTDCYRVGVELAADFTERFGKGIALDIDGHPHLDLVSANFAALLKAGLQHDHIDVLGGCTSCDRRRFFSHRRDHGRTGRQVAFIGAGR